MQQMIPAPAASEVLQRNYSIYVDRSTWHDVNDNRRDDEDLCDTVKRMARERKLYLFLAVFYFTGFVLLSLCRMVDTINP